MQTKEVQTSRVRKTVNDLVMAEMFLLQATIESATAIGDGINELGKQRGSDEDGEHGSEDSISTVLQRIADQALEPYSTRYKYFKEMINSDS